MLFACISFTSFAQVGINSDGTPPDGSAMLDVKSLVKGFLPPRVALTALNIAGPLVSPASGLFVYNTATAGTAPNNVVPGYYCWSGTRWIAVIAPLGANPGDMQYWDGTQWVRVPVGVNGQVLTLSNGIPTWGGNQLPIVSTTALTGITSGSANSGGYVSSDGSATVTARGVCWNILPNPTTINSKTINGNGAGLFTSSVTGLASGVFYYLRAYATNSLGTTYGNECTFTTSCSAYPTINLSISPSSNAVCAGTAVTFTATPTNWGMASSYQWKVNGVNAGTNSTTYTYIPLSYDVVTCVLTVTSLCATGNPATSNPVTMTVNPILAPTVSIIASENPACIGTLVNITATPSNGGNAPVYQWKVNGTSVEGATNVTYSYIPANNDAVTCILTSNALCITDNPATSNTITMVVNAMLPVSLTVTASENPINTGTSVTFSATPVNGGSNPIYQWKVNGINVGTNTPTYSYVPENNDSVKCVLTSNQACITGSPATSNVVIISVNVMNTPCPGIPTVTYSGKTYNTLQIGTQCWFKDNLNIGTRINGSQDQSNNGTIEKYCYNDLESNCDVYGGLYQWAEVVQYLYGATNTTSWNPVPSDNIIGICPSGWHLPSSSELLTLVNYLGGIDVAGGKLKEAGTTHWVSPNTGATNESGFSALPGGYRTFDGNLGYRAYFWSSTEVNATYAHSRYAEKDNIWFYVAENPKYNGYSVRCLKDTCSTYSSTGISILPSSNPACAGTSVTFLATPTNGGTLPFYQWKVNGSVVGTNSPTYNYVPANNDAVTCVMTSSAPCSTNPASSNLVSLTVNPLPTVPIAGIHISSQNQIEWHWGSVVGATGYKWCTTNDFANAVDMGTTTSKTETGLTCNASYTRFVWSYNTCGNPTPVSLTQSTTNCSLPGCGTLTVYHAAGMVAPVNKTVTYGTVSNIPGEPSKCWITSNLGADQQATAVYDATEVSAGWYWQFNRKQGYKHDGTTRTPGTTWVTGMDENSDWLTANDPCNLELSGGWRIPTSTEWSNIDASGNWADWNGPWNSGMKLHAAGVIYNNNGFLANRGMYGYYWSGKQNSNIDAFAIHFFNLACYPYENDKAHGFTLRCLKETCTSSPTSPSSGSHSASQIQITWIWNTVDGASGYKWSTTNDYANAIDMGTATSKTETGLTPGTPYTRYVWAVNSCGASMATTLTSQTTALAVGQSYGGGVIFYIDGTGQHGLIAAQADLSSGSPWGCYGHLVSGTNGSVGSGQNNTNLILSSCSDAGTAAAACALLVLNGYNDWFLPSSGELYELFLKKDIIGGFSASWYWSSTEDYAMTAYSYNFGGGWGSSDKDALLFVRAVRAF